MEKEGGEGKCSPYVSAPKDGKRGWVGKCSPYVSAPKLKLSLQYIFWLLTPWTSLVGKDE